MPAEMLTYWEWAASKGISYRTTSTEKEYHEYLVAAGEPVEPYVPPPPTPPTVTVVNRWQRVTSGLKPKSAYSRVISCVRFVPTGPGEVYSHTQKVAGNVWLYKVKVWGFPAPQNPANQTLFRVLTGTSPVDPLNPGSILLWENILPLVSPGFVSQPWVKYDGSGPFEWTMKRYYSGIGRMFGFWAERGPIGTDQLFASFEISEG